MIDAQLGGRSAGKSRRTLPATDGRPEGGTSGRRSLLLPQPTASNAALQEWRPCERLGQLTGQVCNRKHIQSEQSRKMSSVPSCGSSGRSVSDRPVGRSVCWTVLGGAGQDTAGWGARLSACNKRITPTNYRPIIL